MEDMIYELKHECKDIEKRIDWEKEKLREFEEVIEHYQTSDDRQIERSKARKRNRDIDKKKERVKELKSECDTLLKVITAVEKDQIVFDTPSVRERQESVNQMTRDLDFLRDEIYDVETRIQFAKDQNDLMDKDLKRRLEMLESEMEREREAFLSKLR